MKQEIEFYEKKKKSNPKENLTEWYRAQALVARVKWEMAAMVAH